MQYNFTGWIIGWHGTNGEIVEKYATEGGPEDKKGGGVWMSGGGLAQDSGISSCCGAIGELLWLTFDLVTQLAACSLLPETGRTPNPGISTLCRLIWCLRYASQLSNIPVPGRQPPTAMEEAAVHMAINPDGTLTIVDFCKLSIPNTRSVSSRSTFSQLCRGKNKH